MPQGQRARLWGAAACRAAAPAPALSTCAKPKAAAPGLALCASPPLLERCAGVWMDARSSRVGARGRREAPQGAPRTRNERLHPHAAPRPSAPAFVPPRGHITHICPRPPNPLYQVPHQHHAHTAGAAHAIHGTRAAWPAVRAKPSQGSARAAGACIEQSNAAQCCPRRASAPSVVQCFFLRPQCDQRGPCGSRVGARAHARTLAAACPPRVRLRPPCAAPSLAASRSRAAVPRPPEGAMGVCVSAPRRGCAAGLEGAAALCPDATSGSSDQLAPEWVLTS